MRQRRGRCSPAEQSAMAGRAKRVKTVEPAGASVAAALKAAPKLSAAKEARERVAQWLAEIARTSAGKALKPLLAAPAKGRATKLADLVASIAEASPYLWELI